MLRVIASSPTDLQSVLDAIAETAMRLCGAQATGVHRVDGDRLRLLAWAGEARRLLERTGGPSTESPMSRASVAGRSVIDRQTIHVPDVGDVAEEMPDTYRTAYRVGWRAEVSAPLIHGDEVLGALALYSGTSGPFTERPDRACSRRSRTRRSSPSRTRACSRSLSSGTRS